MTERQQYKDRACDFLRKMVSIKSFSFEEDERATFISEYLSDNGIESVRRRNNIICRLTIDESRPTLLLNSHIDTVQPSELYSFDPFNPPTDVGRILGLGSNDAGASVAAMLHTFLYFHDHPKELNINLVLALSAEEERSGEHGMKMIATLLESYADCAIIGEPTSMQAAIAERGLLVIDGYSHGKAAHAAHREEGNNAIYTAIEDISRLKSFKFDKISSTLGETLMSVTQIESGTAHNIIPDSCHFVIDIRPTEKYGNAEILQMLQNETKSELKARSLNNKTSCTPEGHPLRIALHKTEIEEVVSSTSSDWMRLNLPGIKMGPGDTNRSHKADEFIFKSELCDAIDKYVDFIKVLEL